MPRSENATAFETIVDTPRNLMAPPGSSRAGVWHVLSDLTGAPERVPVIVVQGSGDGPTLWVQSGVHGDEFAASWAVTALAREVDASMLNGRLVLLPVLNLHATRSRFGDAPIDPFLTLHKAFPGSPSGSYMAQFANILIGEIKQTADFLIDVHAGSSIYRCVQFTSYPGGMKATAQAEEMARASGAPFVVRRNVQVPSEHGIMFMHVCAEGIPAIMISIGGHRRVEPKYVQPLVDQCMNVMKHLGMIPGTAPYVEPSELLDGIMYLQSTKGGFVFNEAPIGSWLDRDQVIAKLFDVFGQEVEEIRSPFDRAVLIETGSGALYPGELVAELFVPRREQ